MKLKLKIDPDLVAMMQAEIRAGEKAVSAAMREAGSGLKSDWRAQITGAGLGRRLANSIRSQTFPKSSTCLIRTEAARLCSATPQLDVSSDLYARAAEALGPKVDM
uniref:DUF6441 family protein n=1 Tax=Yoonia sp. TaxID=2212373 RepID=UPI004048774D